MTQWSSTADRSQEPSFTHVQRLFPSESTAEAPGMRPWVYVGGYYPTPHRGILGPGPGGGLGERISSSFCPHPWERTLTERRPVEGQAWGKTTVVEAAPGPVRKSERTRGQRMQEEMAAWVPTANPPIFSASTILPTSPHPDQVWATLC